MSSPHLQPEELFEEDYTLKFQGLVHRRGLIVSFARDRAALDLVGLGNTIQDGDLRFRNSGCGQAAM